MSERGVRRRAPNVFTLHKKTPEPSHHDLLQFEYTFIPASKFLPAPAYQSPRSRILHATLGSVLDATASERCLSRTFLLNETSRVMSTFVEPCGNLRCEWCCVPILKKRVAPAWAFYGGTYATVFVPDRAARHAARYAPVGFKGKRETVGALKVLQLGGSRYFYPKPADVEDEAVLYNSVADDFMREVLRAVPLIFDDIEPKVKKPSRHRFKLANPRFNYAHAAQRVGIDIPFTMKFAQAEVAASPLEHFEQFRQAVHAEGGR